MTGGRGEMDFSYSDSQTDLCQERSVKLYGNPCYMPTLSSRRSLSIPEEESLYEDPDLLLGPSGEYAMTVIVPYEYEQPSFDGSNKYDCIDDQSEGV